MLHNLIRSHGKSKQQYVKNLTTIGETSPAEGPVKYDIIIIGGGMLPS